MKLAILANQYGALSETFVRREVEALQARGHDCAVFAGWDAGEPKGAPPTVPVERWTDDAIKAFAPEVLYASLAGAAHRRAVEIAQQQNIPFALRIWSGFDAFTEPSPDFYAEASAHRLCLGVIVEDAWMVEYARERMGVRPEKLRAVPNSVDVERFCPRKFPRDVNLPVVTLAVARFVPKKGLIHLVRAFNRVRVELGETVELLIVGYGDDEPLRREAGPGVQIRPPVREDELPDLYRSADVFCAPCVRPGNEDGDGIPTTVLEALACGVPVIASDLLSASEYVERGISGLLVPSGDEQHLAAAIQAMAFSGAKYRGEMAFNARFFALEHLDIRENIQRIEAVLAIGSRAKRWQVGMDGIQRSRETRTAERQGTYDDLTRQALAFWDIQGEVLDVGCGTGWMRDRLNGRADCYHGVDVTPAPSTVEWYRQGRAELLPHPHERFDTVLSNSVLQHVEDPAQALREMHRVLKSGGRLALEVNCDDPNPIFLWWWSPPDLLALVELAGFRVVNFEAIWEGRALLLNARKADG